MKDFLGGTGEAKKRLREFVAGKLSSYPEERNDPNADAVSHMSPYLHFGQISPLYDRPRSARSPGTRRPRSILEELIVRRELSLNFVYYNRGL